MAAALGHVFEPLLLALGLASALLVVVADRMDVPEPEGDPAHLSIRAAR
jgi:hypothetical protein